MEMNDKWVPFQKIDWNDPNNNQFNIDTRDFHVGYRFRDEKIKGWDKIKKYPHFFFTKDELIALIKRLFEESGGVAKWRMLSLVSTDTRVLNWNLKYIRIVRTKLGFVVRNSDEVAIPKKVLNCPVNKELLH